MAGIQTSVREAVAMIQGTGAVIDKISGISSVIASAVEQQRSATQAMDQNLEDAARRTTTVSTILTEVRMAPARPVPRRSAFSARRARSSSRG